MVREFFFPVSSTSVSPGPSFHWVAYSIRGIATFVALQRNMSGRRHVSGNMSVLFCFYFLLLKDFFFAFSERFLACSLLCGGFSIIEGGSGYFTLYFFFLYLFIFLLSEDFRRDKND